jgi:hypothetical protein
LLRAAAGLSRTGDAELGWTAAGLAVGGAGPQAGVALRGVARRDHAPPGSPTSAGEVGAEAGGGAWVRVAGGLTLWATAPQLVIHGPGPPMRRTLEIGGALGSQGGRIWLAHRAPAGATISGERVVGVEVSATPLAVWLEARDRPLRGRAGCAARWGRLATALSIEGHPVLGETVAFSLAIRLKGATP